MSFVPIAEAKSSVGLTHARTAAHDLRELAKLSYEQTLLRATQHPIRENRMIAIQLLGDLRSTLAVDVFKMTALALFALAVLWPLILIGRVISWFGRGIRGPLRDFSHSLLIVAASVLLAPSHRPARAAQIAALLYVIRNVIYALASFPIGVLADRANKQWLLAAGYFIGVFQMLEAFCSEHSAFLDPRIERFNHEVQFYVAYLKFIEKVPPRRASILSSENIQEIEGSELLTRAWRIGIRAD